ncbi:MAG: Rrf2 family transcriptional regulator [Actinobacteria bacterium]|nr:Rrf2 family transcriptional regulator [Actinomycetota bacterium]
MRVSMRADYGVRAMTDLAMRYGQGPAQSADVARRQYIPGVYLDQVFTALRKAGLVRSTRGPQGGHELARPPQAINMAEIVAALDGPPHLLDCLENAASCELSPVCSQRVVWRRARAAIQATLDGVSLADLAADMRDAQHRPAYSI